MLPPCYQENIYWNQNFASFHRESNICWSTVCEIRHSLKILVPYNLSLNSYQVSPLWFFQVGCPMHPCTRWLILETRFSCSRLRILFSQGHQWLTLFMLHLRVRMESTWETQAQLSTRWKPVGGTDFQYIISSSQTEFLSAVHCCVKFILLFFPTYVWSALWYIIFDIMSWYTATRFSTLVIECWNIRSTVLQ